MTRPYLLVVTGRPGSGKTTFAKELGDKFNMPVLSRDRIKEGYLHTLGKNHSDLPSDINKTATEIYRDIILTLLKHKISLVTEAAFQHNIWSSILKPYEKLAQITLLICTVDDQMAIDRYTKRKRANPSREYFHGDKDIPCAKNDVDAPACPYKEPRLDFPTFHVDTSGVYSPSIELLKKKIFGQAAWFAASDEKDAEEMDCFNGES